MVYIQTVDRLSVSRVSNITTLCVIQTKGKCPQQKGKNDGYVTTDWHPKITNITIMFPLSSQLVWGLLCSPERVTAQDLLWPKKGFPLQAQPLYSSTDASPLFSCSNIFHFSLFVKSYSTVKWACDIYYNASLFSFLSSTMTSGLLCLILLS